MNSRWRKKLEQPVDSDSLPGFVRVAMPAPVGTEVGLTLTLPNGITLSGCNCSPRWH
ncbi:IS66 family insertion sequence element accessory protein TnpA [Aeromonas hydrophila]|uniref:IS66 family insertion sequence element accessory protein TnpA n=1 Tax=Aeromonas hydrophila TaxID=644 RepID=UPI003CCFD266